MYVGPMHVWSEMRMRFDKLGLFCGFKRDGDGGGGGGARIIELKALETRNFGLICFQFLSIIFFLHYFNVTR